MIDVCLYGDCRKSMRDMIAAGVKVQTCVTSPPYWGLRDYGVEGQLGLESTPDEYVSNMVEVFGLVRDLLADDGTLWLNLGDSYASSGRTDRHESPGVGAKQEMKAPGRKLEWEAGGGHNFSWYIPSFGMRIKPKDLVGIPWRVAFALQAAGWYLRSDIIWHKPNPIPESVTDRPTKAHEYVFLLSKRERYFYDAEAIAETLAVAPHAPGNRPRQTGYGQDFGDGSEAKVWGLSGKRNRRTVWTVATEPYSEAHFATFPTALIEPCILAGSRVGDIVFDPFLGSGTTAQVAQDLGRHWLGCELNAQYFDLQKRRAAQMGLSLE